MKTTAIKYTLSLCMLLALSGYFKCHAQPIALDIEQKLNSGGSWWTNQDWLKIDDDNTGEWTGILFGKPNPNISRIGSIWSKNNKKLLSDSPMHNENVNIGIIDWFWSHRNAYPVFSFDGDWVFDPQPVVENINAKITSYGTGSISLTGPLKILNGSQGAGKVLTSDANGVASWQTPAGTLPAPLYVASGNVGIRTSTPAATLDVYNTTANARTSIFARGADPGFQLGFYNGNGNNPDDVVGSLGSSYNGGTISGSINFHRGVGTEQNFISFTTWNSGTPNMILSRGKGNQLENTFIGYTTSEISNISGKPSMGTFIKAGVDIGTNNSTSTPLLLDVHGNAHFNNDLGTADSTMTKVSINTDTYVPGCALTVAGPTYIGDWRTIESGDVDEAYLSTYNLWVDKGIVSPEYRIANVSEWADDVFDSEYNMPTLNEVEQYVSENGHLQGVPSAKEVKQNGYLMSKFNSTLLRKVEELTLYAIAMEKKANSLQEQLNELHEIKNELKALKANIKK